MLNVGLIGFGFSGRVFHAPVIRAVDGLRLTTIVQRHGTPDPRYSDVEVVRSVEELLTGTIHLLDQALVLFGTPQAVSADIRVEREGAAADDAFDVTLHYPGMRALLRASMLALSPGPTFAAHGTKGSFVKYGLDPQEAALKSGRTPDESHWDSEPPEMYGRLTTPEGTRTVPTIPSSFTHYYENIRDAILGKTQPAVTPEQVLNVMRGLELAVASSRKRCVLPWTTSQ